MTNVTLAQAAVIVDAALAAGRAQGFLYAIRLPANRLLREYIAHLLTRPVGRPPNHVRRFYASFSYPWGSHLGNLG